MECINEWQDDIHIFDALFNRAVYLPTLDYREVSRQLTKHFQKILRNVLQIIRLYLSPELYKQNVISSEYAIKLNCVHLWAPALKSLEDEGLHIPNLL